MSAHYTILIVDDEIFLRSTLAAILNRVGYSTLEAVNAEEAMQVLQESPCDLIFLDLQMPDRDGLEILPEIRRLYPDIPVLILTANGSLEKAIEALKLGARDYLLKPIDPGQIIIHVDDLLKEGIPAEFQLQNAINQNQPESSSSETYELDPDFQKTIEALDSAASPVDFEEISSDSFRFLFAGPFALDLKGQRLIFKGKPTSLPPCSFEYLVTLIKHSPRPVSYQALVLESQGYRLSPEEAAELAHWRIHRLRKSLEENSTNPHYIISIPGFGYKLSAHPEV